MNNINGGHTKTQTDKSPVAPAVGPNPKPSDVTPKTPKAICHHLQQTVDLVYIHL